MKKEIIILRVSKKDKEYFKILAKENDISVSELIRRATLKNKMQW